MYGRRLLCRSDWWQASPMTRHLGSLKAVPLLRVAASPPCRPAGPWGEAPGLPTSVPRPRCPMRSVCRSGASLLGISSTSAWISSLRRPPVSRAR